MSKRFRYSLLALPVNLHLPLAVAASLNLAVELPVKNLTCFMWHPMALATALVA